jgi:hypothetical protein
MAQQHESPCYYKDDFGVLCVSVEAHEKRPTQTDRVNLFISHSTPDLTTSKLDSTDNRDGNHFLV